MSFLSFLDEEIHRLKVQSPVDEVAELALDDIGKFSPLTVTLRAGNFLPKRSKIDF